MDGLHISSSFIVSLFCPYLSSAFSSFDDWSSHSLFLTLLFLNHFLFLTLDNLRRSLWLNVYIHLLTYVCSVICSLEQPCDGSIAYRVWESLMPFNCIPIHRPANHSDSIKTVLILNIWIWGFLEKKQKWRRRITETLPMTMIMMTQR